MNPPQIRLLQSCKEYLRYYSGGHPIIVFAFEMILNASKARLQGKAVGILDNGRMASMPSSTRPGDMIALPADPPFCILPADPRYYVVLRELRVSSDVDILLKKTLEPLINGKPLDELKHVNHVSSGMDTGRGGQGRVVWFHAFSSMMLELQAQYSSSMECHALCHITDLE